MDEEGKDNANSTSQDKKDAEPAKPIDKSNGKHVEVASPDKNEESAAELKDRLLRLAAEFDNYKKRTRNDIESARKLGKVELAKGLLYILDEFELAMIALNGYMRKPADANSNEASNAVARGIEMVYSNFIDTLKKEGIEEIKTGGSFDPYMHEIIMVKESSSDDGTILEVVKKGYKLDNILIRPASVIISKKASGKDGKAGEAKNG